MIISPEEVAATHAYDRPGARLIGFEEVAIPYFLITVDAVVQRRKRLGALDEFTLSAIDAGMRDATSVAAYLGLDDQMVEEVIWSHWQEDRVDLLPGSSGKRQLMITEIGAKTLRELISSEPERSELPVPFDRLTWKCTSLTRADLVRDSVLPSDTRRLPPRVGRRPRASELPLDAITETIRERLEGVRSAEVLAVKDVLRAERWWREAVLLVYESVADGSHEIGLAVDGRISREHELAVSEQGGLERLGINLIGPPGEDVREADPEIVEALTSNEEAAAELKNQISVAKQAVTTESKRRSYSGEEVEGADSVADDEALQELEDLRKKLARLTVQRVEVFEHRDLLEEALTSVRARLLIISPWIRTGVVNRTFIRKLEKVCQSGVKIHFGWGLGDDDHKWESDRRAQRDVKALADKYPNFVLCRLGNTHAKVLIWDDTWVSSSFNWLSFRGDPSKTFRQEEGILIRIPEKVDATYSDYVRQIEDACPQSR